MKYVVLFLIIMKVYVMTQSDGLKSQITQTEYQNIKRKIQYDPNLKYLLLLNYFYKDNEWWLITEYVNTIFKTSLVRITITKYTCSSNSDTCCSKMEVQYLNLT